MSLLAFETPSSHAPASHPVHGRRHRHAEDSLVLTELNPHTSSTTATMAGRST